MYFYCSSPHGNGWTVEASYYKSRSSHSSPQDHSEAEFSGNHVEISDPFSETADVSVFILTFWIVFIRLIIGSSLVYPICSWSFFWEAYLKQVSRHVRLKDLGGPLFCLKNRAQTSLRKAPRASKMCLQMQLVLSGPIESYTSTKLNVPRFV